MFFRPTTAPQLFVVLLKKGEISFVFCEYSSAGEVKPVDVEWLLESVLPTVAAFWDLGENWGKRENDDINPDCGAILIEPVSESLVLSSLGLDPIASTSPSISLSSTSAWYKEGMCYIVVKLMLGMRHLLLRFKPLISFQLYVLKKTRLSCKRTIVAGSLQTKIPWRAGE